jgi:hypothetical protein
MRYLLVLLSLVVPLPAAAAAQEPAPASPAGGAAPRQGRVTLELSGVPLRKLLDLVSQGTGVRYEVEGGIPDPPLDLSVRAVPVEEAVRRILRAAAPKVGPLELHPDPEDAGLVRVRRAASRAARFQGPRQRVSLRVHELPLRAAVERLTRDRDVWCAVDPNVPDVPVTTVFSNVSLESGVWLLAGAASEHGPRLAIRREGVNFALAIERPASTGSSAQTARAGWRGSRLVNLNLKYTPLRKALGAAGPGIRFRVEPDVPDVRVTLRLRNLTPDAAVRQIVGVASLQARGVSFTRSGDVYVVHLRI